MNSFLNWFGGKRILSKEIVKLIPDRTCYVEVFAGVAWVFFRKDQPPVDFQKRAKIVTNLPRVDVS